MTTQVPLAPPPPTKDPNQDRWLWLLWRRLTQAGQILWSSIDKSGSNLTDIETRNHNDLQSVQGGATNDYYHLTSNERTDLLGASYLTLSTSTSLTSERTIAFGSGLAYSDAGAGSTYTISQVAFTGDSGTGGVIGAVPAPSAGDGAAQKYLSADGVWRNVTTIHNQTDGIQGGSGGSAFNSAKFNNTAFNVTNTPQYYHLSADDYNNVLRQDAVTTVSANTTMTDSYSVYIVDTSAKTMTLPLITAERIGKTWTVVMNCNGFVDVAPTNPNEVILYGGSDTIRLDQLGSVLTMRAVTSTQWVIV